MPIALAVPCDAASITAQWLGTLAWPSAAAQVCGAEVGRIAHDLGLASELYRCRLSGRHVPASVVVKLWDTAGQAGTAEAVFYTDLAASTPLRLPACYFAGVDAATNRGVLVLEDFGVLIQGDCLIDLDWPQALPLAQALARLHAAWWNSPEPDRCGLPTVLPYDRAPDWHAARRPLALERFGEDLRPALRRCVEYSEQVQATARNLLTSAPVSLLHGDLQLDNVLFDPAGGPPVLLDWARCASGPAVLDLAELLFGVVAPAAIAPTLDGYLTTLDAARRGATMLDEFKLHLSGAVLRRSLVATLGTALWQPERPRAQAILAANLRRQNAALDWLQATSPELLP